MTSGNVVLITGATAGIGRVTALRLARAGHRVFATGRRRDALASLEKEAAGTGLEAFPLDVTDAESIARAVAEVNRRTEGYGLDVLVNNAGYGELGPVETIDEARVRKQYDTNVFGLLAVTKAFVGAMRERGAGRIINVSSVGGRVTFPLMGVYTSTKHAVEALSDALRIELRPFGVRVSVIQPGAIATEFSATALDTVSGLEGSPYAPLASRVDEIEGHFSAIEVGPEVIAAAIERAATSRRPRARYVAPFSAKLVLLLTAILPTSLLDWVYGRLTGLRRHALRPSPSEGALGAS